MPDQNRIPVILGIGFFALILASCARVAPKPQPPAVPPTQEIIMPPAAAPIVRADIFHTVGPSETLWRISKMYDVNINDIVSANRIRKSGELKMGQKLLIPGAAKLRPVINLYASGKWRYIIIHHSATDTGSALSFYRSHLYRGWKNLGYHFVIDNGTGGKQDGQIEISPRWLKQQDGAHCKAQDMNTHGIGICLVGNFSADSVSEKQMDSLIYLVDILRRYYNIPLGSIKGHCQVRGARTECPGRDFPWQEFEGRLRQLL